MDRCEACGREWLLPDDDLPASVFANTIGRHMAMLVVQSGKNKGLEIALPVNRELVIGRTDNAFLRINSTDVSRQHCLLKLTDRGLLVKDLGSRNGTLVNDAEISKVTLLRPGDRLLVGHTEFLVEAIRPKTNGAALDWMPTAEPTAVQEDSGGTSIMVKEVSSNTSKPDASANPSPKVSSPKHQSPTKSSPANASPANSSSTKSSPANSSPRNSTTNLSGISARDMQSSATMLRKRPPTVREEARAVICEHFESLGEPLPERFRDKDADPSAAGDSH